MNQKYPIGIQDFKKLRLGGYLYIDKTEYIYNLADLGGYYFLSRPRRFGKSLVVSTFESLFLGKKDLFEGTFIYDKWDWENKAPVIRISFADIDHKGLGLNLAIQKRFKKIASEYEVEITSTTIASIFQELIQQLYAKYNERVVVLIDEYDKPIIDFLGNDMPTALENQATMKTMYSIIKDADRYLRMVFITGVSKFSKVSIFSDLNNFIDISIEDQFAGICGISEQELNENFVEELKTTDRKTLKEWYNGYTWDLRTWVYNPFSLLSYFRNRKFENYWFETGTPTFLIELNKKLGVFEFEQHETTLNHLSSFDIENLQLIPVMFQTGYLTFKHLDDVMGIYTLDFPNKEVKKAYLEILMDAFMEYQSGQRGVILVNELRKSLIAKDFTKLESIFNSLFKSIPSQLWAAKHEHILHAIVHIAFKILGIFVVSEVHSSDGRLDSLVVLDDAVFCFEFKLDKSAEIAMKQIEERGYLQPYYHSDKKCYAIGVNFSSKNKKVEGLRWEQVNS